MPPARRVYHEGPGEDEGSSSSDESSYDMVESVSTVMRSVIQKRGKRRSKKQTFQHEPLILIENVPQQAPEELTPDDTQANVFDNFDFDPMPEPSSLADDDDEAEDEEDDILPSFGPSLTLDDDDETERASTNVVDLAQFETEKVRTSSRVVFPC